MNDPVHPLGERREKILHVIVEHYVRTAEPVASKSVADDTGLKVSSATVRNEMGILEREGYITHPHTSAGRVPTERGYRYYVDVLAPRRNIDAKRYQEIERSLVGTIAALDDLLHRASELLAEMTDYTALASAPPITEARIRFLDLVPLAGTRAFMILVGEGARTEERIVDLGFEPDPDALRRSVDRANSVVTGTGPSEAAALLDNANEGLQDAVFGAVAKALRDVAVGSGRVYTGGTSHMVTWGEPLTARRVLRAIEGGEVGRLLSIESPSGAVEVRIGSELLLSELSEVSLIASGYGAGPGGTGTLGVIGPTRMDYPAIIAVVSAVARSVSRALKQLGSP